MTAQNLPAMVEEYGSGLEDLEGEVGALPRLAINHREGTFKDSLTGEEFGQIVGVPLAIIRQRVMWNPDVEENKKPWCKSNDATRGFPNMTSEREGGFPWSDAAGLDPNTQPKDEHDRTIISCTSCPFTAWGKDAKTGKAIPPPCKERYTIPIIYNRDGDSYDPPYMDSGIVSFQGSGIKPTKAYASAFIRGKLPLYSAVVRIKLNVNKRGMVEYSVPEYSKVATVPDSDWEMFAQDLPNLREYLTRDPRPDDDGSDPGKGHGQTAAQAAHNAGVAAAASAVTVTTSTTSAVSQPIEGEVESESPWSASPPPSSDDDDALPF